MKTCTCGGSMRRHSHDTIKSTGELKIRFRCVECNRWESYYRKPGSDEWNPEHRRKGRPMADDIMFKWALR